MNSDILNVVLVAILVLIIITAIKGSIKHFKGDDGCCGGGGNEMFVKRRKLDRVLYSKKVIIKGMVCDNCARRIHNALNSMEGISAKVIRSKDMAVIKYAIEIDDEKISKTITDLGYKVEKIEIV